jgi:hypothetical protein
MEHVVGPNKVRINNQSAAVDISVGMIGTLNDELNELVVELEVTRPTFSANASEQRCFALPSSDFAGPDLPWPGRNGGVDPSRGIGLRYGRCGLGTTEQEDEE